MPIKNIKQQDIQTLHRKRAQHVKQCTALSNQLRGILGEYGIANNQGIYSVIKKKYSFDT